MKKTLILLTTFLLLSVTNIQGQFFAKSIIKTRPFQDFVGFNPNIGFEKPIFEKITLEIEYMYRNKTWYSTGGEWNFGKFHQSNGFRILGGIRKYIGRNKTSPFAWFFGLQFAYSDIKFDDLEKNGFNNEYQQTVDQEIKYPEIIANIGKQFQVYKRLTIELYIGASIYMFYSKKTEIKTSVNPEEIGNIENTKYPFGEYGRLNFGWTIGYKLK